MPERKYKTDKESLLAEGRAIVSSGDDAVFLHRVGVVNLVLGGMAPSELSRYVAESKNTITSWVKRADEQGFESLRPRPRPGRPRRLDASQLAEVRAAVASDDPGAYGYRVWDGPSLSDHIAREHGVELGARQCQRLLREMGFSLVRPQRVPPGREGLEAEREAFKKTL